MGREPRCSVRTNVAQVLVEKTLDAAIAGTEPVSQLPVLLVIVAQQRPGDFEKVQAGGAPVDRLAHRGEFEVDVAVEFLIPFAGRVCETQFGHTFASIGIMGIKGTNTWSATIVRLMPPKSPSI